ncbi:hypothetical protein IMG5_023020, partial [Ichthyophthirius multifiliis]
QKQDAESLRHAFKKFDPINVNSIDILEIDEVLKQYEFKFPPHIVKKKIMQYCQEKKLRKIDFLNVCQIFLNLKNEERLLQEQEEIEYIDAFVALGGNQDKSGFVNKDKIIEIIKKEFDLTIDIEDLIEKSINSQELNFQDFCQIFENAGEEIKSKISLLSGYSKQKSSTSLGEKGFQVKYKDFEIWFDKMEGKI